MRRLTAQQSNYIPTRQNAAQTLSDAICRPPYDFCVRSRIRPPTSAGAYKQQQAPPRCPKIWVLFGYYGHKKPLHDTAQQESKITILRILLYTTKPHKKNEPQFVISRLQVRFLLLAPKKRTLKRIVLAFFCFLPVLPYVIWVLFGYYGLINEKKAISQQALCRPAGRFFYACFFGVGEAF